MREVYNADSLGFTVAPVLCTTSQKRPPDLEKYLYEVQLPATSHERVFSADQRLAMSIQGLACKSRGHCYGAGGRVAWIGQNCLMLSGACWETGSEPKA